MQLYLENETEYGFEFDTEAVAKSVINKVLEVENCPYDVEVNLLITDNEGIREYNREMRGIDNPTDVLSFPNVDYEAPADFTGIEDYVEDYFDPETGELILGDIVISIDKVYEQAKEYGHAPLREFAFLVAHSMLHLLGYDHMEEEEAKVMEAKQEEILTSLGITR